MNDAEDSKKKIGRTRESRHVRPGASGASEKAATVHAIIPSLQEEDGWIRGNAAEALVKIGVPAVPALMQAMQDEHRDVRRGVADVLGKIGDSSAVTVLILALQDTSEKVRRNAAIALGQIRSVTAVPALITAMHDENRYVRENAAEALGHIGDVSAVPALIQALKDRVSDVRYNVSEALGRIGDSGVLPRKIVVDGRMSPKERVELLADLRRVRYRNEEGTFRYSFPDTRTLCQTVLNRSESEACAEAQAILKWLDEGHILVRASQCTAASGPEELLRAAQGEMSQDRPETLLRGSLEPDKPDENNPRFPRRTFWERLFGK